MIQENWSRDEVESQLSKFFELYAKDTLEWSDEDWDLYQSENPMLFSETKALMVTQIIDVFQEFTEELYNDLVDIEEDDIEE